MAFASNIRRSPTNDSGAHPHPHPHAPHHAPHTRMLITAGPTHEPIDAVRFIGNRSSGRMGVAIAEAAVAAGWDVTLLLGPMTIVPEDARVKVIRFRTCDDLRGLLGAHVKDADVLVMAAAVADYRPKVDPAFQGGKFRRTGQKMVLELEPTPDLLAEVSKTRRTGPVDGQLPVNGQLLVGFALEPRDELLQSAKDKLARKGVDMVVANPLETMDSSEIEGLIVSRDGETRPTSGVRMSKVAFAAWLIEQIGERVGDRVASGRSGSLRANASGATQKAEA